MDQERNHKIFSYVTEREFYDGLNEAKRENLFVDEKGRVDIGELLAGMWLAFGEGRMVVVPRGGFKPPEKKEEIKQEAIENKPISTMDLGTIYPAANALEEFIEEVPKKKRPSRAKAKKEIAEPAAE